MVRIGRVRRDLGGVGGFVSGSGVERRMPGPTQLEDLLARQRVVLIDGGLATELERRGADLDDPLWSARLLLDAPVLIRQVHVDYYAAGADIATTASYQASFEGGRGSASRVGTASTSARGSRWPNASTRSKAVHRSWLSASTARRRGTFPRLVAIASSRTAKPVVVYPNSGERFDVAARRWHGDVAVGATLAEQADQWYRLGARLIGGCCRTTPDDIRALRAWAASLQ